MPIADLNIPATVKPEAQCDRGSWQFSPDDEMDDLPTCSPVANRRPGTYT